MGKIKQQFLDFKESTPKYVQWLLLIAALVIVVVLVILLLSGKQKAPVVIEDQVLPPAPAIYFDPAGPIDWSDTNVGEIRTQNILVSSNTHVSITSIRVNVDSDSDENPGITSNETCTNSPISPDVSCTITLQYNPTGPIAETIAHVAVQWVVFDNSVENDTPNALEIKLAAHGAPIAVTVESNDDMPDADVIDEEASDDTHDADVYVDDDVQSDAFQQITPFLDFDTPQDNAPSHMPTAERQQFGQACSDFAFPGYDTNGLQSGWIRPMGGAYYYHPFSDTECANPTGMYNADTGYIMDINNPTRKIGSDAEHVRYIVADRMPTLGRGAESFVGTRARQLSNTEWSQKQSNLPTKSDKITRIDLKPRPANEAETFAGSSADSEIVVSSRPYDRTFLLRQYKPIPATIVSDIQADPNLLKNGLPVRATVDRNVYSDNGRTVIIPTGTLMLGFVQGDLPGPYKAVGRMEIEWYQFIRPDGVEFNFAPNQNPFSADSQGRKGVPGHGSTDYLQQFVMPMLTAIVPAAVNMIAPISDAFVNQIDLDNNTVVQTGTVRSSELAKNEIIKAWNNVATKLLVDMMDNTTPPFSIAAGTRITVFSPVDLLVTCGDNESDSRKCAIKPYGPNKRTSNKPDKYNIPAQDSAEMIGQVRSMLVSQFSQWCIDANDNSGAKYADPQKTGDMEKAGYSFATVDFYCRSLGTYDAINNARQKAVFENQKQQMSEKTNSGSTENLTKEYNQQVLGLKYNDDNTIQNPFQKPKAEPQNVVTGGGDISVVTCDGGANPDANGCCPGETYTDMGDAGMNCCPDIGGDCFPPINQ